jgi:hypothetical protein
MRALSHYFLAAPDIEPRRVGMYARTPKPCSCWMCGNPRRHHGEPTLRERRERGRSWLDEATLEAEPVAVVVGFETYQRMLADLEELDAVRAFDAAQASREHAVPFEEAVREIEAHQE